MCDTNPVSDFESKPMRIFHVSETPNIARFEPRPTEDGRLAVWAIDETHLPNYLLPRECPRVCVRNSAEASPNDLSALLGESAHVIYVEAAWHERIVAARLFVYEFSTKHFVCIDTNAGYFQSEATAIPTSVFMIDAIESDLRKRGVELRYVESLWPIQDAVPDSSLEFSCIRLRNARAADYRSAA
jgi:hypothetical protein